MEEDDTGGAGTTYEKMGNNILYEKPEGKRITWESSLIRVYIHTNTEVWHLSSVRNIMVQLLLLLLRYREFLGLALERVPYCSETSPD
jgi:hypothetical protein